MIWTALFLLLSAQSGSAVDGLLAANTEAETFISSCRSGERTCAQDPERTQLGEAFLAVATWRGLVTGERATEELATARFLAPNAVQNWDAVLPPGLEAYPAPWVYSMGDSDLDPRVAVPVEPELREPAAAPIAEASVPAPGPGGGALRLIGGAIVVPDTKTFNEQLQPTEYVASPDASVRLRVAGQPRQGLMLEGQIAYLASSRIVPKLGPDGDPWSLLAASGNGRMDRHVVQGHVGVGVAEDVRPRLWLTVFGGAAVHTGSLTPTTARRAVDAQLEPSPGFAGVGPLFGGRMKATLGKRRRVAFVAGSTVAVMGRARLARGPVVGSNPSPDPSGLTLAESVGDSVEIDGELAFEFVLGGPVALRLGMDAQLFAEQPLVRDETTGQVLGRSGGLALGDRTSVRPHLGLTFGW